MRLINETFYLLSFAQGGVSFSQAGATVGGGPAPAHVQSSGHVVLMPQPPPQTINQAPIHNQQQHAAQFQQQLQGQSARVHAAQGKLEIWETISRTGTVV